MGELQIPIVGVGVVVEADVEDEDDRVAACTGAGGEVPLTTGVEEEEEVDGTGGGGGVDDDSETVTVTGAVVVVVNLVTDDDDDASWSRFSLLAAAIISSFSRTSLASFLAANDAAALDFDSVVFVVGVGSSPAWVLVSRRVETAFSKSSSLLAGVDVDEIGAREGELDEEDDDDEAGLARAARRRSEVGAAEDGGACEGGVGNCAG